MARAGVTLSVRKTEAIVLTSKRRYKMPKLKIRGEQVDIKDQITYL